MNYFVTGITGFIGQQFLESLTLREGVIYALVRPSSIDNIEKIRRNLGISKEKLIAIKGDLCEFECGVDAEQVADVHHFYHLGAIYDLAGDTELQKRANIEGTKNAIALAEKLGVKCFHHISSIVAGGFYPGLFKEDMFEEAKDVDRNAYFYTKHESEKIVRRECRVPWRVYRPGVVVGNSETGWAAKIDGPYYFFELINTVSQVLPRWVPLPVYRGNSINIVPVDFVAKALDHISHQEGHDGKCFHLTNPHKQTFGSVINTFLKAAKGPTMKLEIPGERLKDFLPTGARVFLENKLIVDRVKGQFLENLGIPKEVLLSEGLDTQYDCTNTIEALKGSGISVPKLRDYANRLWSYWEQHLNPEYLKPQYLSDVANGKVIMITGGSEGIGREVADNCANAGATVILVARTKSKLDLAVQEIRQSGGDAYGYTCDLSDLEACDKVVEEVRKKHGFIDVLVNNAGRSIRRSLSLTYNRFHDFERVMQINYFSAIRLAMNLLPSMSQNKSGHIVNISSIAAISKGTARFSSYMASKAALDAWSESAALEYAEDNIAFTNIHMPLVRTKMIEATKSYQNVNVLTTKEAGELVNEAIINRPREVNTTTGNIGRQFALLAPKLHKLVFSTLYQITDDSDAAKASALEQPQPMNNEQKANRAMDALERLDFDKQTLESIANILHGYHT